MNRLRFLREEQNISQAEIGMKLGITSQAVGLYENEKRDIPNEYLIILSNFFNVTIDYLLGKSDIRNPRTLELTDDDIKFIKGIKKLDETNKMIIENTMEALLDKQEKDKNN